MAEQTFKGFCCEPLMEQDQDNHSGMLNVFYLRPDGTKVCIGQTYDFHATVESTIRQPLPTWMTGRDEPEMNPYADAEYIRSTCAHGVSLRRDCDSCIESHGSARAR